jgi:hypothetical protein
MKNGYAMKNLLLTATAAFALLVGANAASAQGLPHEMPQGLPHETPRHGGGTVTFAPEHGHMLREHATTHHFSSAHQSDFRVEVGATLPHSAQLHPLPDALATHLPAARSYQYSIVNNRHVIVEPGTRRIIHAFH